ncbi:GNAT family N-acetyltransferase [Sphingomicrobium clamense]|uniref:GNAT family N-acetyltransferase n=1 Tax=Sphingomicrobium clamense TaxID=2851013 RepID=A0ABS6V2V2_9SPHN|nr:GNAT family N-acetyltransferase [Sphingomicrobium sp. B8]MBW0143859.1 GNAT family N-acetyltransferase [Sphingomicrobium sp. B8]
MKIESATVEHIPVLHRLIESAYRGDSARGGWTHEADLLGGQRTDPNELAILLDDPTQTVLIGRIDGDIAACIALTDKGDGLFYFGMLTIDPERQGQRLGSLMLEAAERHVVSLGAVRMEAQVIKQREELIAWYERRGYARTGETRPFPYGDPRFGDPKRDDLEFIVLEKPLS